MKRLRFTKEGFKRAQVLVITILFTFITTGQQVSAATDKDFFSSNDIEFYDQNCSYIASGGGLVGNSEAEQIWNFLISAGLNDVQAAGVMGNLAAESGYVPTRHQATASLLNDNYNNAWGIAQWDGGRRYASGDKGIVGKLIKEHPELKKYTDLKYDYVRYPDIKKSIPPDDLKALLKYELDYLLQESKARAVTAHGFGDAGSEWETMKQQKSIEDATVFWHNNFEVSNDTPGAVLKNRGGSAKKAYDSFAGKTPSAASSSSDGGKSVIFIDPGHGGAIAQYTDTKSGLVTSESPNSPEREDALEVSNRVKSQLEKLGYTVILSRTSNTQKVTFRERADAALKAKAAIGISIHTTPGEINEAWPQRVGTYREYGSHKDTFTDKTTAAASENYANVFAQTRTDAEGHKVTTDPGNKQQAKSFGLDRGSAIPSKGNIPLISLWATNASTGVPWVYNEIAQNTPNDGITEARKAAYAKGIVEGVKKSVPLDAGKDQCGNDNFAGGDLSQTTLAYAWPEYHPPAYTKKKPEYQTAVEKAQKEGRYVGGLQYPGVDCGGFVTTLLVDSGFEPKYNYGGKMSDGAGITDVQEAWAKKNWKSLGGGPSINPADLQPGDVAFSPGHTFVYVGKIPGFGSTIASASVSFSGASWRSPMAGHESPISSSVRWYRKG